MNRTLLLVLALGGVMASVAAYITLPAAAPAASSVGVNAAPAEPALLRSAVPSAATAAASATARAPELERLDARRQLYESVDALVQASEYEKARQLLDEDQTRYGDDSAPQWRDLEQSYRLIADCLERPTAQLRVKAQAFALVSEAQRLRPRILSACKSQR